MVHSRPHRAVHQCSVADARVPGGEGRRIQMLRECAGEMTCTLSLPTQTICCVRGEEREGGRE